MKQKIGVRAIIRQGGKILLIRRMSGRESLRRLYELPGGSVGFGEAPEIALRRQIKFELNVTADTVQLNDVLSELDIENNAVQHIAIIYSVSLLQSGINLNEHHDKYIWRKISDVQIDTVTSMTALGLGLFNDDVRRKLTVEENVVKKATIFTDGGSRGNPGPSASGYVITNDSAEIVSEGGEYIGVATNNQAEYSAVLIGMQELIRLGYENVEFRLDSELVVNQLNGTYKNIGSDLIATYESIKKLEVVFKHIRYRHVNREYNTLADGVVNRLLDKTAQL